MFVKICGLSTRENVDAALAAGADAVGFVFADSVRRVEPAQAAAIANKVPDTIKKVAVMLHPSNEEWRAVLRDFSPDVLQTDAEDFAGRRREERAGTDRRLVARGRDCEAR